MPGRPLNRARRQSTRSLTELLSLLDHPLGDPLLSTHSEHIVGAFRAELITASEVLILRHHASLSVEEQERALKPLRSTARQDIERLRTDVEELRKQRRRRDEG